MRSLAANKKSIRLIGVIYYAGMVLFVNGYAALCCSKVKWMISSNVVVDQQKFCG